MIKKISGKSKAASNQYLNINFNGGTEDMADPLGDAFSKNSSNAHYSEELQNYQTQQKKIKLNFKFSNNEE